MENLRVFEYSLFVCLFAQLHSLGSGEVRGCESEIGGWWGLSCSTKGGNVEVLDSRSAENSKRLLQLIGMQFIRYYAYCICITQALFVLINRLPHGRTWNS